MNGWLQSLPKISETLENMIKEGCENKYALLIRLIFYKIKKIEPVIG